MKSDLDIQIQVPPNSGIARAKYLSDAQPLFRKMLETAGYDGSWVVRVEDAIKGSPGKSNTIKFQHRPVGSSGIFMLYVNWQAGKPDSAFSGFLSSGGRESIDIDRRLRAHFPSGTFSLSRDGASQRASTGDEKLALDGPNLVRLATALCDRAVQDPHCLLTQLQIDSTGHHEFPWASFGHGGLSGALLQKNLIEAFDNASHGEDRRFYIPPALFQIIGRVHPDRAGQSTSAPQPLDPAPAPSPVVGGMSARQFLREIREMKDQLEEESRIQDQISKLEAEKEEWESEILKAQVRIDHLSKMIEEKSEELQDPKFETAREGLRDFESLFGSLAPKQ